MGRKWVENGIPSEDGPDACFGAPASSSDSAAGAGFGACGCNAPLSQLFPGHFSPSFFTISRQFFALFYRLARKPVVVVVLLVVLGREQKRNIVILILSSMIVL